MNDIKINIEGYVAQPVRFSCFAIKFFFIAKYIEGHVKSYGRYYNKY